VPRLFFSIRGIYEWYIILVSICEEKKYGWRIQSSDFVRESLSWFKDMIYENQIGNTIKKEL